MYKRKGRYSSILVMRILLMSLCFFSTAALLNAQEPSGDFEILFPGVYTEKEKAALEQYFERLEAIETRGDVNVAALISGTLPEDTPGIGPTIEVTEAMVRYNNEKYDPENPILNDAEYARHLGYQDILAFPTFGAFDDFFLIPYPSEARDTLLAADLNHNLTNYRPVYPGDTLYLVQNGGDITDLTPREGAVYRSVACRFRGSIYNQRGEKVTDLVFSTYRHLRIYKPGRAPENPGFRDYWDAPDWMRRPAHTYTDDDWDVIRHIWANEKRQGAVPLYWEDVNIGDEPAWTADGPVLESVMPTAVYGMGTGGSRTMKREIMDPDIFRTMIRGETDGIYRLPDREDYVPPVPDLTPQKMPSTDEDSGTIDTADIHKQIESRAILINYMGREFAIRHIHNWMGDHGWLYNIRWSIMDPLAHAAYGKSLPTNPRAIRHLEKIPKMRRKHVLAHGLTGDLAIVKSCVYDKYVRNGEFFVELGWWVETIDGYIWQEGGATVRLPSSKAK